MSTRRGDQERVRHMRLVLHRMTKIELDRATNIIAEVDAISENSREDYSSIETKSPMPSIGRISGFSTLEAVSEEDENREVFNEYD